MREFKDRVCVVTGAASGIGRGLAEKAAAEGMKVVLADRAEEPLAGLHAELEGQGARVASRVTDVGDALSVEQLAELAYREFGGVHLVFNNAGVLVDGLSWERSLEDWRWSIDVNLMGVIHGIRSFVPRMLEGAPGVVVNTSSLAGLIVGPFLGPYSATKHAVVGITETLFHELRAVGSRLRAAVLCPGEVATRIWHSNERRPHGYGPEQPLGSDAERQFHDQIAGQVGAGMTPRELGTFVFGALASERFWLFPHPAFKSIYEQRARGVLQELDPSFAL